MIGKRTTNNAFADKGKLWNSYGVASFDLSGILLGQQVFIIQKRELFWLIYLFFLINLFFKTQKYNNTNVIMIYYDNNTVIY